MFTDAQFMTAAEKTKLAKAWTTFVKHGMQERHFTDRIYKHLSLHCGHIAHYDIHGFYATWFEYGDSRVRFLDHFLGYRVMDDYTDVQAALVETLREHEATLREAARADEVAELRAARAALDARLAGLT